MPVRLLLALVSGGVLATSFEPLAWWWVTPACVAGLALSVAGLRPGRAWWPALVFAVAFYFPHIVWMRAVSTGAWLALAGIEALFYAALGPVLVVLMRHRAWPLWGAGAWALAETVRSSWPFSGMPWGRLGFGVMDTPVAPVLAYLGATGVGFALALGSFCLAAAVLALTGGAGSGRPRAGARVRAAAVPLATVVVLVALTGLAVAFPVRLAVTGQATVAAVQPDVPGAGDDILAGFREVTASTVQETVDLAAAVEAGRVPRPDLVLWPENSTAVDPFADAETNAGIRRASEAIGVPVVVGGIVDGGPGEVLNQGLVWEPGDRTSADVTERYTKRHPVPYGEYIPARDVLEGLGIPVGTFGDLALIPRDMVAGERTTPLQVGGVAMADAICFDVAYDDVLHDQVLAGAELLAVQTSNATFIATDQVDQQFAITRARAVEAGRWLVVASTNGITGVIAPDGSVVAAAPRRSTATLLEQVDLVQGVTPGVRVGRHAGWGALGLTVAGLALGVAAGRRRVPGTMEEHEQRSAARPAPPELRSTEVSTTTGPGPTPRERTVMIVPTYDEAANLAWIVGRLHRAHPDVDVLVVDDASPDGTGRIADDLAAADGRVNVLHRTGKAGLGAAYLAGFGWALERGYDVVGEMDADGSHAPEQLDRLRAALVDADLVIGSRYVRGGAVHNWPLHRQALSRGGNAYVRLLLGLPVRDATAGYRLFRRAALERIDLAAVRSVGYVFQTDLAARTVRAGLRVREVPIDFVERQRGESKMNGSVATESLRMITRWGLAERRAQLSRALRGATAGARTGARDESRAGRP